MADQPCLRDGDIELTYTDVARRAEAIAERFAALGVRRGDVVAIMLPNCAELLLGLLAAWRLGAAATPVNPAFTANEAGYQIQDSGAVLLLTSTADADYGVPAVLAKDLPARSAGVAPEPATGLGDLALLIYTSGSTGRPKGVMLDHSNLVAMASSLATAMRLDPADHCLLVLPLFHVNAICVSFLAPMVSGAQVTILARFAPHTFLEAVERYRPTYFAAVPAIYARLAELPGDVRPDTSSVRFAVCGAAPVPKELLRRCESRFGFVIIEGYGLTEGTCASTVNPVDGVRKPGTVGPALPGQRVAAMSPDGSLLPAGQPGEVVIQGANVMRGYLGRPEATAEALAGGWLHTGDVGFLDVDGYLTLVDRIKDMIIRGGENIAPAEIEDVLLAYPGIAEAAVIGVPDPEWGQRLVAVVVGEGDAAEIQQWVKDRLRSAKTPDTIVFRAELPKTETGKLLRRTLVAELESTHA